MAQFFLEGIRSGFRIGVIVEGSEFKYAKKNMQSALEHAHVIQEYLSAQIQIWPTPKKPNSLSSYQPLQDDF